ncbi:MAG: DNA primase [Bacteroidales bacterium]|nr:DNA primase [Bacteroidales bacterium]MBR6904204.1 DNA primase [Bacteroidales bacterium]
MIKQKSIDSVMAAVRIEDVVGDFVSLRKQGQDFVGICPFHDDKNPSLHVSPRLGIYKCFVCDAAGNPVKFLMEHEKMSYPEAIEYLAKKYGIPLEYERNESEEERQQRSLRESLLIVNEFALKFFMDQLRNTEEGKLMGMSYLKERGFQDATIDKFQLGYSPDAWDSFTKAALEKGYKEEYLIELGLTGKAQSGKLYDIYRGRVIFPIHNDAGKVIGFGGRVLKKDGKDPRKYVNSRENTIYHKSDTLYGIYFAKNAIHKQQNVYLVEGYTDVISMHESGVENVVASSGTSLTQGQIRMITKRTQNITVLYDGDMAGIKASMRGIDMLLEQGLKIRVCLLPDGEDPDSFAKKHRDSELQEYLSKESKDFLLFKADILSKDAGNDPIKRASMVNEILKSISCVKDNIERAFYIKECAKLFDLSENDLNLNLRRFVWEKTKEQSRTAQQQAQQQAQAQTGVPVPDGPQQQDVPDLIETKKHADLTPQTDLLYEAEKELLQLMLNYGNFEIYSIGQNNSEEMEKLRIDQYICNEMLKEGFYFHYPPLQQVFDKYAEWASFITNQDQIIRNFTLLDDTVMSDFVIKNFIIEEPSYSEKWKKKFDIHTHTVKNNLRVLQNHVQNIILSFKLRILDDEFKNVLKILDDNELSEEIQGLALQQIDSINKSKRIISQRLNRVLSH